MQILYVEDNQLDADLVIREFERTAPHIKTERVATYREAMERLGRCTVDTPRYDLVLTDMKLPDGNGLALIPYIRDGLLPISIVVITGVGNEETAVAALKAGASDYVVKGKDYLARLPVILENAHDRFHAEFARYTRPLHVLYAEWDATDIDLTRRHMVKYAPYISLDVVGTAQEILHRFPSAGGTSPTDGHRCDVLLLDYHLPGMSGLELLKELYETRRLDLPVVLVTGYGDEEIALQAMRLGATDYVAKNDGYLFHLPVVIENAFHRAQTAREQKALKKSEEKYAKAFNTIPTILTISRLEDGKFLEVNETFLGKFGFRREEVLGRTSFDLQIRHDPEDRAKILELLDQYGSIHDMEFKFRKKDGGTIIGLFSGEILELNGEKCLISMVNDITERRQVEAKTIRHMENLAALRMIDSAINSSLDLPTTLNVFLEQTVKQLQADAACVLLYDPHSQMLEYTAGLGFLTERITSAKVRLGEGYAGRIAFERKPMIIAEIVAVEESTPETLIEHEGFKAYIGVPLIAKGQVKGVLEIFHRAPFTPEQEWLEFAEALAGQAAIAIDNAELFENLQRSHSALLMAYDTTIEGWARALDLRDRETEGHSRRVTGVTERLARIVGISDEGLVHIRRGALLHDIGKLGVRDTILLKPGGLSDEEQEIMRDHPNIAYRLLSPIAFLQPAIDIPFCHHERWDGSGYPRGLKGEEIPLAARIFAIVDVWDALRSDRTYRLAWPAGKVREHIRSQAGTHFDPAIVDIFMAMEEEAENFTP